MRSAIAALALLAGCSSDTQACQYDLYIYSPPSGADIFAVAGEGRAAAVEVRGCGDVSLLSDAQAVVARMQALRAEGRINEVTLDGHNSRTQLGPCAGDGDVDEERSEDRESLVVLQRASAAQMRRTLLTLDAAPRDLREQMISTLALRTCGR